MSLTATRSLLRRVIRSLTGSKNFLTKRCDSGNKSLGDKIAYYVSRNRGLLSSRFVRVRSTRIYSVRRGSNKGPPLWWLLVLVVPEFWWLADKRSWPSSSPRRCFAAFAAAPFRFPMLRHSSFAISRAVLTFRRANCWVHVFWSSDSDFSSSSLRSNVRCFKCVAVIGKIFRAPLILLPCEWSPRDPPWP
jgi:hypothetical protein